MENWSNYSKANLLMNHEFAKELIEELATLTDIILSKKSKKIITKKVKLTIINIAHSEKRKYKVYANGFSQVEVDAIGSGFVNKEWLYDVHLYTDVKGEDYMPELFLLACECEWSKHNSKNWKQNFKDIGYDFQKLLFCNALLRLFICRVNKQEELGLLHTYFSNSIKHFRQLEKGAHFLFICYCWETKSMHYQEILKA